MTFCLITSYRRHQATNIPNHINRIYITISHVKVKLSHSCHDSIVLYNSTHSSSVLNGGDKRDSDSLRAGWFGDRKPVRETYSVPVQTSPRAYPVSVKWVLDLIPGGNAAGRVALTPTALYTSIPTQNLLYGELYLNLTVFKLMPSVAVPTE